jgi:hypothetical protein
VHRPADQSRLRQGGWRAVSNEREMHDDEGESARRVPKADLEPRRRVGMALSSRQAQSALGVARNRGSPQSSYDPLRELPASLMGCCLRLV